MKHLSEHAKRVRKVALQDIYMESDGFYVFSQRAGGFYTATDLRIIADFLEELNLAWKNDIGEYFSPSKYTQVNKNLKPVIGALKE